MNGHSFRISLKYVVFIEIHGFHSKKHTTFAPSSSKVLQTKDHYINASRNFTRIKMLSGGIRFKSSCIVWWKVMRIECHSVKQSVSKDVR